jgi:hypothetical protein
MRANTELRVIAASFIADGERKVSTRTRLWFRKDGRRSHCASSHKLHVNGKFTPNRFIGI